MILASPARWANTAACLLLAFCVTQLVSAFASGPHTLTITTVGSGAVARNPNFAQYPNGSVVTLTATPAADWLFSHWTGDLTGNANPINIEMTSARTVGAHFVPIPVYTVSTDVSGQGTIALNPPGGTYQSNSTVTVTATAAEGWAFASWSGDASGSTTPLSFQVDSNKSITANFAELVTITEPPANVVTNSGSTVRFNVIAQGTGPLHYQWSSKNQPINDATTATLTIDNAQTRDEGTYTVTISNLVSSATANATLVLADSGCTGSNVVSVATEEALRNAIELGGHVQLCFNGTITLTQAITITKDVSLDATGRQITISGEDVTRIFNVQTNVTFTITNLTLTRGRHQGEEAEQGGHPGFGGAIWNRGGTLLLVQCVLTNNAAIGGNGKATSSASPGGSASGGAILNEHGIVTIISSVISSNTTRGGMGISSPYTAVPGGNAFGGAIASSGGAILISSSRLSENFCQTGTGASLTVNASGGAIHYNNSAVTITNSIFHANTAMGSEGSFGSIPPPPTSPSPALGGAIRAIRGRLTIENSDLSGNSAIGGAGYSNDGAPGFGGALYSEGSVFISVSTIHSNLARGGFGRRGGPRAEGGAWYNSGQGFASESVFHSNVAQGGNGGNPAGSFSRNGTALGGAIRNGNMLALTNCTLTMNVARSGVTNESGPNPGDAAGGGIFNSTNSTFLAVNATIASNAVWVLRAYPYTNGSSLGANIATSNGVVTLRNTILAYPNGTNSNVHGPITDGGHNISSDASANFNSGTSFNFTDPRLGPLGDNGGPTMTMALLSGSPAIDFGDSANAPSTDQRGVARPFGDGVDIGAYEFSQSNSPSIAIAVSGSESVQLSFQAAAQKSYRIQRSTDLIEWNTIETIPASENSVMITREYNRELSHAFYQVIVD